MKTLDQYNIIDSKINYNLSPEDLYKDTINNKMGVITDGGVLSVNTGKFTGRSPKDRYIVEDEITQDKVWWGEINKPFSEQNFDLLQKDITSYLSGKEVYVRDSQACALDAPSIKVRTICELPWNDLFVYNMFIRNSNENREVDWSIISAPGFFSNPQTHGTDSKNFAVINFSKKIILIGGTAYTGEIKKGIFSVLNFILPAYKNILPMHCSANIGDSGDTSIFFGLSGTGKTTLSTEKGRKLIGDDEHGWDENNNIFNFEGGCYAKVINLSREKEPDIFDAIKPCALLENVIISSDGKVDFNDSSITQNSRVSYPIHHIKNIISPSLGKNPKNIFFLTADAFGVLPPISKLSPGQAAYHFISGYTSKLAGTEVGINDPIPNFSTCFGAPFMPLHPTVYADMLIDKMNKCDVNIWLVNTGWVGGPFGIGKRIQLKYTRAMISAANTGELDKLNKGSYKIHPTFKVNVPVTCPNVPDEMLDQEMIWRDKELFEKKQKQLVSYFKDNFSKFKDFASDETTQGGPL